MHELVRTNNAVLITAIEALLKSADIPHMVLDQHMSVLEGSLGMLPRRIVVDGDHWEVARQLLEDAGLAHELRPGSGGPKPETTDDAVLGGRLRLKQKKRGHRVGHDAILLAAVTAAQPGDRVVEFGSGVGAAGLALAVRCPEVELTLVEIDPELAAIADRECRTKRPRPARPRRHARCRSVFRRVRRCRDRRGLGRSRADEPAVQQSRAAERLAGRRPPQGARGRGGAVGQLGLVLRPRRCIRRGR